MTVETSSDLQRIYERRFAARVGYRRAVWRVLIEDYFQRWVEPSDAVLDLGCGYGEFINQIACAEKFAMDLNPDTAARLDPDVTFLQQDCSRPWALPDERLDVVFTSNFFEHLPDKGALGRTLDQVYRCLKHDGRLIALGPNLRYLPGAYWDFWDHHLPLTDRSLQEAFETRGFVVDLCVDRFLPYTMARGGTPPTWLLRLYLRVPIAWRVMGRQFLLIARKPR